MSWDLQWLQSQIQMMTGDDGIADKVTVWANRALAEIASAAVLPKLRSTVSQFPINSGSTTITAAWNQLTADDCIQIDRIQIQDTNTATTYYNGLVRNGIRDLYAYFHGSSATYSQNTLEFYAVPRWSTFSTSYLGPQIAVFPNENAARAMEIHYLKAFAKLASASDTNWCLRRYPQVVLSGTSRRAFLYKGKGQEYFRERARFENGIRDIIKVETGDIAHAPVLRAQVGEQSMRDR